ncbi:DUF6454 family protein [Streptomyces aurantiacus]|uniref:SMP-30/Gluconolactonase/LRE-like region domain-containing protein n=1 Tax=Streptomyces aurantiacus JA 4570 TaxID=1286094 RepID=S4AXE7_9ACTN|nr:DUF6454 family protein [Streptomyces aurantiacus]EPH46077.1 hypothetical protein STRAU_0813 [Streptomyces aurantiacus JA 4570]
MELTVNQAITRLNRFTEWAVVEEIPLDFACHHPQGLERVGDNFFLSSVEVTETPRPLSRADHGAGYPEYTAGCGRGHVFEVSRSGRLLRQWELREDTAYHAGGLTFDGTDVWVPVAEYRPDSRSIMYRLDPVTGEVQEMFRYADHVGGVARDARTGLLHAITWGGRRVLVLTTDGELVREIPVRSHYIDFQDCVAACDGLASWTGVMVYPLPDGAGGAFQLGGIAVLDMESGDIVYEVPVTALSPTGRVVTMNATDFEVVGDRLRMYALPDDSSTPGGVGLLVLEAEL